MCLFDSGSKTTSTTKSDSSVEKAKSLALDKAVNLSNLNYTPVKAQDTVAGARPDQQTAWDQIRVSTNNAYDPNIAKNAIKGAQAYAAAPAQHVDPYTLAKANTVGYQQAGLHQITTPAEQINVDTIMNEDGRLGAIDQYMNPYLQQVLAPALREINQQGAVQRNAIKAGATSAGAFGDARHGVVESEQYQDQGQQVADTTGQLYAGAYGDAMARRTGDRDALMSGDIYNANSRTARTVYNTDAATRQDEYNTGLRSNTDQFNSNVKTNQQTYNAAAKERAALANAGYNEAQINRMLQGSTAALGIQQNLANTLLASGNQQQGEEQKLRDAHEAERLRAYESQYRQLDTLLSFLNGAPNAQTVTTKQDNGSSGVLNAVGSALGSFFG